MMSERNEPELPEPMGRDRVVAEREGDYPVSGWMIRFYEWAAGKLIVRAARARGRRGGPGDAHELRHLLAAITAGNSDPCDGGRTCHLDAALMRKIHDANFGSHPVSPTPQKP